MDGDCCQFGPRRWSRTGARKNPVELHFSRTPIQGFADADMHLYAAGRARGAWARLPAALRADKLIAEADA